MIVDEEFREETMKVIIRDGKVLAMSKRIPRAEASGTYIGITKFSRRIGRRFFAAMAELIAKSRVQEFFNAAVEQLIAEGTPVSLTKTAGLPWAEIDDAGDLRHAQTNVYPRLLSELTADRNWEVEQNSLVAAL